jgi:hypothetical protein
MKKTNFLLLSIQTFKILLIIIFISIFISSCKDRSPQPETDKTLKTDTNVVLLDTATKSAGGKITKEEVLKMFSKESHKIENKFDQIQQKKVYFSDLNGNGYEEAIVYYTLVARGGTAWTGSGLIVYEKVNDELKLIDKYDCGNSVIKEIKDGVLYMQELEYAPGDPNCCPSIKKPYKLGLINGKIERIK